MTLPETVHPNCWRQALHLGGNACIADAAQNPVQGKENEVTGGNCDIQSAITLLVVETLSALIPTELLSMMVHWRRPRAFPAGKDLAPFWI